MTLLSFSASTNSIIFNAPNHQGIGVTKEHKLGGLESASYNALALSTVEHKIKVSADLFAITSFAHYSSNFRERLLHRHFIKVAEVVFKLHRQSDTADDIDIA